MDLSATPSWPLRTDRLELRPFTPDDVDDLFAIHSDPVAVRYVPYAPRTRDGVVDVLRLKAAHVSLRAEGDLLELAATLRSDGTVVGDLLLILRSVEHQTLEVGYIFSGAHAGQGYATEAVRALLDLAFGPLGARRVIARVDARNDASRRLLLRLGFRQEAELVENEWFKGELSTEVDFAVLSREWGSGVG